MGFFDSLRNYTSYWKLMWSQGAEQAKKIKEKEENKKKKIRR